MNRQVLITLLFAALVATLVCALVVFAGCGGAGSGAGGTEAGNPAPPVYRIVEGSVPAGDSATKSAGACAATQVVAADSLGTPYAADVESDCAFHLGLPVDLSYTMSLLSGSELVAVFVFQDEQGASTQTMFVGAGDAPVDLGAVTIVDGVATPQHQPAGQSAHACDLGAVDTSNCSQPNSSGSSGSSGAAQVLEVRPFADQGISAGSVPVGRNEDVQARASCAIDPATVTAATFTVSSTVGDITCDYKFLNAGSVVKCLHATQKFAPLAVYTATIDGVRCVGSAPLPATSWSWMTSDKN